MGAGRPGDDSRGHVRGARLLRGASTTPAHPIALSLARPHWCQHEHMGIVLYLARRALRRGRGRGGWLLVEGQIWPTLLCQGDVFHAGGE